MIYCNCSVLSVVFGTFLLCLVRLLTYCNIIDTFGFFLVNYCNVSGCFRYIFLDDLLYFFQYFQLFSVLFCCVWYIYWLTVILSVYFAAFWLITVMFPVVFGTFFFFWWFTVIFQYFLLFSVLFCCVWYIYWLKVALDGGTRPRSNPPSRSSATPKPPLYYLPLCAQGTPFTHPPSWIFQGHSVGHSFTKDNNLNCYLFFKENMHFRWKILNTHARYIYI